MSKLKAFTLFELVVSLTVSAILIGIVYTSMGLIQRRFDNNKTKMDRIYDDKLMLSIINRDLEKSPWITVSSQSIICHLDSIRKIQYYLTDSNLVRNDSNVYDTLSNHVSHIRHWYQSNEKIDSSIADKITLELTDNRIYSFEKWYSADILIHF